MPIPLLSTKFNLPPSRPNLTPRLRLIERLDVGLRGKLTLISAPAGFGKTTLVSAWLRVRNISAGWVSLDENDNDPVRFLSYFVAALQSIEERFRAPELEVIKIMQSTGISSELEALLSRLINEVVEFNHDCVIVLDDYHLISNPVIQDILVFILDNQPPHMHLVITTRADPPWPLSRLRARQQITELRVKDLRFTLNETTHFLADMGLKLTPENIIMLESKTEGWVAGLQLAALSMQGYVDKSHFITTFIGDNRFIVDYLVEEVLEHQSSDLQDFMLKTSILERINASLCDALLENDGSQIVLRQLEQANLFLLPLDEARKWHRYHRLFADLLHSRLGQIYPGEISTLHRRASEWFAKNGFIVEAVGHALEAKDYPRVIRLVEGNAFDMLELGELATLTGWLDVLPEEWLVREPWMSIIYAWVLAYTGQLDAVEPHLENAQNAMQANHQSTVSKQNHLFGHIAAIQTFVAKLRGEMGLAVSSAEKALNDLPSDDYKTRCFVATMLGTVLQWQGKLADAVQAYDEAITAGEKAGDTHTVVHALCDLAGLQLMLGQLHKAETTSRKALQIAGETEKYEGQLQPGAEYAHSRLSGILFQKNELKSSLEHAQEGLRLSQQRGQGDMLFFCYATLAGVQYHLSGLQEALATLQSARLSEREATWHHNIIEQMEAGLHLEQGDVAVAIDWVQKQGWKVEDEILPEQSFNYTFLARILIAQNKFDESIGLLNRLVVIEERKGANGIIISLLVLKAVAWQAQEKTEQALDALQHALKLGEPDGYIRTFVNEGAPIKILLQKLVEASTAPEYYAYRLLDALESSCESEDEYPAACKESKRLIEPLSVREQQVLLLLDTDLRAPEIANKLFVSVNTVRSHIKSLYRKLNAHSRHEAVVKARQLDLL